LKQKFTYFIKNKKHIQKKKKVIKKKIKTYYLGEIKLYLSKEKKKRT